MGAIVLQFVEGSGFGSDLIKWFDHGRYSHVDTVMPDGNLLGARDDTIDSIPAGVQLRPASYVADEVVLRVTLPCTDGQQKDYYDFVTSQIGKPYDEKAIMAFAVGADWHDIGGWFCSQLVAAGLQTAGVVHKLASPWRKIAPDDLLLIVSAITDIG